MGLPDLLTFEPIYPPKVRVFGIPDAYTISFLEILTVYALPPVSVPVSVIASTVEVEGVVALKEIVLVIVV